MLAFGFVWDWDLCMHARTRYVCLCFRMCVSLYVYADVCVWLSRVYGALVSWKVAALAGCICVNL